MFNPYCKKGERLKISYQPIILPDTIYAKEIFRGSLELLFKKSRFNNLPKDKKVILAEEIEKLRKGGISLKTLKKYSQKLWKEDIL